MENKVAKISIRQDTTENWLIADPILKAGELTWDITAKSFKVGDGINKWSSLEYANHNTNTEIAYLEERLNSAIEYTEMHKQDRLISGMNIATIEGKNLLANTNVSLNDIYQSKLVSGVNIKTIEGESILGAGNIDIQVDTVGNRITIDSSFNNSSPNAIANQTVTEKFAEVDTEIDNLKIAYNVVADSEYLEDTQLPVEEDEGTFIINYHGGQSITLPLVDSRTINVRTTDDNEAITFELAPSLEEKLNQSFKEITLIKSDTTGAYTSYISSEDTFNHIIQISIQVTSTNTNSSASLILYPYASTSYQAIYQLLTTNNGVVAGYAYIDSNNKLDIEIPNSIIESNTVVKVIFKEI